TYLTCFMIVICGDATAFDFKGIKKADISIKIEFIVRIQNCRMHSIWQLQRKGRN
ncbi:MAG: hypothetical protein ACI9SJ_000187, partial [Flavobacteriaceae bacterium]